MARITEDLKERVITDWKKGVSQNDLAKIYDISKGTVNKWCKGVEQTIAPLVNAQVQINQNLAQLNDREMTAFRDEVTERCKHIELFTSSAIKGQHLANKLLDSATSLGEVKTHSSITRNYREAALGKEPTTAVQVNNNITTEIAVDELRNRITKGIVAARQD